METPCGPEFMTKDKVCLSCNQAVSEFEIWQHEETKYCKPCFNSFLAILKDATHKLDVLSELLHYVGCDNTVNFEAEQLEISLIAKKDGGK